MGRIRRFTCSAKNCKSVYSHAEGGVQMLTFPKDANRCRVWVQNSGNKELLKKTNNKLHKLRFLCKLHFADDQYLNKYRTRLSKMAVPTIFSEPPLSDKEMELFEVVIEVSDLPGRLTNVEEVSVTSTETPDSHDSAGVMDHTYATAGDPGDTGDCELFLQDAQVPQDSREASSTPEQMEYNTSYALLQKLESSDSDNSVINEKLYKELLKMEKKVQDLQQEVDRLKAMSKSEVQPRSRPDLVRLLNVNLHDVKKTGDRNCELNEELVALAIFRC
ncbi:52 kDa repressor of the inhibitor of the protein kinase-like isoform X4 [Bacillus rossius redtenbacheri]|uniref:52 kDa repressor of the inhibitor of the protein kinase-like isoform X4 n=1 Tax=Bacillus rossius redtenbacheri TaxID=93214 RepID=UPI002FDEDBEC